MEGEPVDSKATSLEHVQDNRLVAKSRGYVSRGQLVVKYISVENSTNLVVSRRRFILRYCRPALCGSESPIVELTGEAPQGIKW
jgi:hypothetical protein